LHSTTNSIVIAEKHYQEEDDHDSMKKDRKS